jgi:hypothetical protein
MFRRGDRYPPSVCTPFCACVANALKQSSEGLEGSVHAAGTVGIPPGVHGFESFEGALSVFGGVVGSPDDGSSTLRLEVVEWLPWGRAKTNVMGKQK